MHRSLGIPADYAERRGLSLQTEAREGELRVIATLPEGRAVRLIEPAAQAWWQMREAAIRENPRVVLVPVSGFRSVARQEEIIRDKRAAGQPLEEILRLVAAPGHSEHHTGRALDIGSPEDIDLDVRFGTTAAFRWLSQRAGEFGFTMTYPEGNAFGIGYEPWHWCWAG